MEAEIKSGTYNRAVLAGSILLIPSVTFWIVALVYRVAGFGEALMGVFAGLEATQSGVVVMATLVIGLPFFALPLTVIGRWLTRINGQKGIRLADAALAASIVLLVLGLALPLALRR